MNESDARRRELLRQTRRLYHETGRSTPVIHPRYGNLTTSVTEDDAAEDHSFLFCLDGLWQDRGGRSQQRQDFKWD